MQILDGRGVAQQPLLVSENHCDCPFVRYQNIRGASFSFVTIYVCDRQTDGQNCESTTVHCIACSCMIKIIWKSINQVTLADATSEV